MPSKSIHVTENAKNVFFFMAEWSSIVYIYLPRLYPLESALVAQAVKNPPAMWETRAQSLGREDPLEKEMATHSSILAWRIPWTEDLGGI